VASHLGGVRVDQLVSGYAALGEVEFLSKIVEHKIDFAHRCAIEATAKGRQKANNDGVGVALHRVEGLNHWQLVHPLVILVDN